MIFRVYKWMRQSRLLNRERSFQLKYQNFSTAHRTVGSVGYVVNMQPHEPRFRSQQELSARQHYP